MLHKGDKAPDFLLPNDANNKIALTDLLQFGPVLLYFYPADFTPGCTKEACSLRDSFPRTQQAGITVVGVSPQSPESHQRFREKHELPFMLLSDENKETIRAYDADGPFGIGVRRVTYLVNQEGIIEDAVLADFRIGRHAAFVEKIVG